MIRAVLFDYGGVLSEGGKARGIQEAIAALTDRDVSTITIGDLHMQMLCSQITDDQYFDEINKRYPCTSPVTRERFIASSNIYSRSQPVYALVEQLRTNGIRTGILSNMYGFSATKLRAEGAYDGFDPVVLSCEERLAKPDKAFFEVALKRLGIPADEVLFVDDQERFRAVAEELGMHFIVATSPEQIVADVTALLNKENNLQL